MITVRSGLTKQRDLPVLISARCPGCHKHSVFQPLGKDLLFTQRGFSPTGSLPDLSAGQRRCPDPKCGAHLFFIAAGTKTLVTYPAETIPIDSTDLPDGVDSALREAATCHANQAFVASAIMVRKTLEELCQD